MTFTEQIAAVRAVLGLEEGVEDVRIGALLDECRAWIVSLSGANEEEVEIPDWLLCRMARECFVRIGAEGLKSRDSGSIRESYETGVFSAEVLQYLQRYRRLRVPQRMQTASGKGDRIT